MPSRTKFYPNAWTPLTTVIWVIILICHVITGGMKGHKHFLIVSYKLKLKGAGSEVLTYNKLYAFSQILIFKGNLKTSLIFPPRGF